MSNLRRLATNDEGFVFDPATGDSFVVNESAALLIRGLQEGLDESRLTQRLTDRFDVDRDRAAADIDDFLLQLKTLRLV
jgi:PqqD family protein of HPr-rel-A system